jgi:protein-tyrosine phosphatase
VIDLHAHILPGVDDGPDTLEESLALARAAVDAGTRVLAATSHVSHMFPTDPALFPGRLTAVREALQEAGVPLDVVAGGELAPSRLAGLDEAALHVLSLGGGPYLLVECPFSPLAAELEPLVFELQRAGWGVLLAHPERSAAFHRAPDRLAGLVARGALVQITAGSLTGQFGETARRYSLELLREELVHVLASDAHDAIDRPPGLSAGIARAEHELGSLDGLAEWLTDDVPAAILAGDPLPPRPPRPRPRRAPARVRA